MPPGYPRHPVAVHSGVRTPGTPLRCIRGHPRHPAAMTSVGTPDTPSRCTAGYPAAVTSVGTPDTPSRCTAGYPRPPVIPCCGATCIVYLPILRCHIYAGDLAGTPYMAPHGAVRGDAIGCVPHVLRCTCGPAKLPLVNPRSRGALTTPSGTYVRTMSRRYVPWTEDPKHVPVGGI